MVETKPIKGTMKRLKDQKLVEDDFIILRIKENSIGRIKETREDNQNNER